MYWGSYTWMCIYMYRYKYIYIYIFNLHARQKTLKAIEEHMKHMGYGFAACQRMVIVFCLLGVQRRSCCAKEGRFCLGQKRHIYIYIFIYIYILIQTYTNV